MSVRLGLAFCLLWCCPAWAAPALSGIFSAGELGLIELSTSNDGLVVAKFKKGGVCGFKPDRQVLTGTFEGNVFIGTVVLCQSGPSCEPERPYPFLGVWHESSLSGDVKLASSCVSDALDLKRLNIGVATMEEKLQVKQETGSAAQIANQKPVSKREQAEAAEKALLMGHKKMKEGDYRAAAQNFERGISYAEENWAAHAGLGVAELKLKNTDKALSSFQRALVLSKGVRLGEADLGELHYNLACAYARAAQKRDAMSNLTRAIKLLGAAAMLDNLDQDQDLNPLRNEPDFRRLVAEARIARERQNRRRSP